jgi:putative nucleotidyltransferase with HDIG domain
MPAPLEFVLQLSDRVLRLTSGQMITAGRMPQCELQLDDAAVSRRHCTIACTDEGLRVSDLDSANGTFINEQPVREAMAGAGDRIRLGATIIDVRDAARILSGAKARAAVLNDSTGISPVIERRIEPSTLEWLTTSHRADDTQLELLRRAQRHLAMLHRVSDALSKARTMEQLSESTLQAILDVLPADRTAVVLRPEDPANRQPEVAAARTRTESSDEPFTVSRTLVSDVIGKGLSVFAHDASSDARFSAGESVIGQHVRSVMCVPLRTADQILGALYVDSLSGAGRFSEADLELLAAIGNQAGVALHRVRLMGELERLLLDTIRAIAATIDARDGYTHRHSERVAALTGQLARELGMSDDERQTAELSALLHDVGKIAVPDAILNKPGRLTPEETAEMQKHTLHGARILGNIETAAVKAVIPGVQYHHERWDGTGYPEGLKGENIPLLGRLLGVADFYDALTSARAYRPAMPPQQAVDLIVQSSGHHFDPAIVGAALRLFERGELLADVPSSVIVRLEE